MKLIKPINENEMIAAFLKGEISSSRFSSNILEKLQRDQKDINIIKKPNLKSDEENQYRKHILMEHRGYGNNTLLFENFPADIVWHRVRLKKSDLKKIKYINGIGWRELSNFTRLAAEGAKAVKKHKKMPEMENGLHDGVFWNIVERLEKGKRVPSIILVGKNEKDMPIVLEGHARVTAFIIAAHVIPEEFEAIIGLSENLHNWFGY